MTWSLGSSVLHAKDDLNDTQYVPEPQGAELVDHLDVAILLSVNLESEPGWSELDEAQAEMTSVGLGIMRLDVADTTIVVFELALDERVGLMGADSSKSAPGRSVSNDSWKYWSSKSLTDTWEA